MPLYTTNTGAADVIGPLLLKCLGWFCRLILSVFIAAAYNFSSWKGFKRFRPALVRAQLP